MTPQSRTVLLSAAGTATAVNVLDALRRSKRYAVRSIAVDAAPDAVGLRLATKGIVVPRADAASYIDTILSLCIAEQVDFVFPLHSSEIPLFAEAAERFAAHGIGLMTGTTSAVDTCIRKDRFIRFLRERGLPHPTTYEGESDVTTFPVFLKPVSGSSSSSTFKVSDREELRFYLRRYPRSLIQEFVDWRELTVDCYVTRAGCLVGCVPRYRVRVKDGKSVVAETTDEPVVIAAVEQLLTQLQLRGPCNVQLFFDGLSKVKFIEVNPRLAAGGLSLATEAGTNIPELMLREADGESLTHRYPVAPRVRMYRYFTELFEHG